LTRREKSPRLLHGKKKKNSLGLKVNILRAPKEETCGLLFFGTKKGDPPQVQIGGGRNPGVLEIGV